jgi:hypothetical protein
VHLDNLWHAAECQGKRVILINYPDAFPKLPEKGVEIGGRGVTGNDWTVRGADFISSFRRVDQGKRMILGGPGMENRSVQLPSASGGCGFSRGSRASRVEPLGAWIKHAPAMQGGSDDTSLFLTMAIRPKC